MSVTAFRLILPAKTLAALVLLACGLFAGSGDAKAQVCLAAASNLSLTQVDIVTNTRPTASGNITMTCTAGLSSRYVGFCFTIAAVAPTARDDTSFNLFTGLDGRLAWSMRGGQNNELFRRSGATGVTAGGACTATVAGAACVANLSTTLSYLDRSLQDKVRAGLYTGAYLLSTTYFSASSAAVPNCSSPPAPAGTLSTPFTVTANVPTACQFENIGDINFGSMGAVQAVQGAASGLRGYGNVGVRCTYDTPYSVTMSDGLNASGGVRRMKGPGTNNFIPYLLFQPGCTVPWTMSSPYEGNGTIVSSINNHQVCGQLAPSSNAPAFGTYTDRVVVTATF